MVSCDVIPAIQHTGASNVRNARPPHERNLRRSDDGRIQLFMAKEIEGLTDSCVAFVRIYFDGPHVVIPDIVVLKAEDDET